MAEADVFDDGPAKEPNMAAGHKPLVNENPRNLVEIFYAGIGFIEAYGWLIIFGLIFVMVLWTNISKPLKKFFQGSKVPYNRDVTDSMTTEQVEARMVAMDKARQKMQDRYNEQATKMSAKRKEVEEQKRLQKISDHDALMSGKTQSSTHHKMEQVRF
ncbi:unnamed protein product [Clavelina lepadiformis]|uniref:Selenoprotein S n=1 Tax=Clavelina lepadiformis TaxID=159417 RepID=A0ABP0GRZ4_CLALP